VHYDKLGFVFLGINSGRAGRAAGLMAVPPLDALQLLQSWGLAVPEYAVAPVGESPQALDEYFESKPNSEGAVVYVSHGPVCTAMYKHKSARYTILRAAREQMRARVPASTLVRRLQRLHLPVAPEEIEHLKLFYAWAKERVGTGDWEGFMDKFLSNYSLFRSESAETLAQLREHVEVEDGQNRRWLLLLVGPPGEADSLDTETLPRTLMSHSILAGSGKTTLGRAIAGELNGATYIDQDAFGQNGAKQYAKALKELGEGQHRVIICGKCHMSRQQRAFTLQTASCDVFDVVAIVMPRLGMDGLVDRIRGRGTAHETLRYLDDDPASEDQVRKVVGGMLSSFEEPDVDEGLDGVIDMDALIAEATSVDGERPSTDQAAAILLDHLKLHGLESGAPDENPSGSNREQQMQDMEGHGEEKGRR
jgi:hypothetical protein